MTTTQIQDALAALASGLATHGPIETKYNQHEESVERYGRFIATKGRKQYTLFFSTESRVVAMNSPALQEKWELPSFKVPSKITLDITKAFPPHNLRMGITNNDSAELALCYVDPAILYKERGRALGNFQINSAFYTGNIRENTPWRHISTPVQGARMIRNTLDYLLLKSR